MPKTLKNLTIGSVGGAGWRATRLSTFSTSFSLYGPLWKPRQLAPPSRALSTPHGRRSMSVAQGRTCIAPAPASPTSPRSRRFPMASTTTTGTEQSPIGRSRWPSRACHGGGDRQGGCEMKQHIAAQRRPGGQWCALRTRWPDRRSGKAPPWARGA